MVADRPENQNNEAMKGLNIEISYLYKGVEKRREIASFGTFV